MKGLYIWSTFAREETIRVETSIMPFEYWRTQSNNMLTQANSGPVFTELAYQVMLGL